MFCMNGVVHEQNEWIWGVERLGEDDGVVMDSLDVITCCTISKEHVIRSYILRTRTVPVRAPKIDKYTICSQASGCCEKTMFFQHYSAPPHYANCIPTYLNKKCTNNWIGRDGLVAWPIHSFDLTPCDIFCGVLSNQRNILYAQAPWKRRKNGVRAEILQMSQDSLTNVWDNTKLRLNYKMKVKGGQFKSSIDSYNLFVLLILLLWLNFNGSSNTK